MNRFALWGVLFLLGCTAITPLFAQVPFTLPDSASFYTFLDLARVVYPPDSAEGGDYNKLQRMRMIWGPRLAPHGQMSRANRAMLRYTRAYYSIPSGGSNQSLPVPVILPAAHPSASTWQELGPNTTPIGYNRGKGMGQIHRLAFHPAWDGTTNKTLYAGSHYGGLFRSDDGGDQWYNYHTDRGLAMTSIGGVAASAHYVFVCTGNGDHTYSAFGREALYEPLRGNINNFSPLHTQGVFRNQHTNPTARWLPINGTLVRMIDGSVRSDLLEVFASGGTMRNIFVHPRNEAILLIATSQGIFRTGDGGQQWTQVLVGPPDSTGGFILDTEWRGLVAHPTQPDTLYASGKDVYRSTDGGLTWSSMTNYQRLSPYALRTNLAVTPAAPERLYAYMMQSATTEGVVFLYDQGAWQTGVDVVPNNAPKIMGSDWLPIAVSPVNPAVVHVGGLSNHLSTTIGMGALSRFTTDHQGGIHDDVHALAYPPRDSTLLYAGTHGGVHRKASPTRRNYPWTYCYEGLGVSIIWAFDDWAGDDSLTVLGLQDVGINLTYDRGRTWIETDVIGDGYSARIDDRTGLGYFKFNDYRGTYQLYPAGAARRFDPIVGTPTAETGKPYDRANTAERTKIANTFPLTNHPKTDVAYLGFSELYRHPYPSIPDSIVQSLQFMDTTITVGRTYDIYGNDRGSSLGRPTCASLGGLPVGLDTTYLDTTTTLYTIFRRYINVDTVCQVPRSEPLYHRLFIPSSDLYDHQNSLWDRRITDIVFSEEEGTDYTYLVTLGDWKHRRSDLYVQDLSQHCDTCFVVRTAGLPIDPTIPNSVTHDPNPITGIAVDPLNGNRIWASFSGYAQSIKVWYSEDAGTSWQTYDDSLGSLAALNLPINGIVYQRGTKDRLYIATDAGVYVREAGGTWLHYGENIPNVRVTELKINYCAGKLRAATFGRGIWENDLLPVEDDLAYRSFRTVSGVETWTADKHLARDLRIKAGGMLILQNMTLNMPQGGLIVIEPGGQLIADSSVLTNLCGQGWQGIQVWGQTNRPQTVQHQGVLVLLSSTIEHAKEAVSPWQVGNFPRPDGTGGTGGIVRAQDSRFVNNWRSVGFMRYRDSYYPEQSFFKNCTFTVNDAHRQGFLGHLSAWDVSGLTVQGCTFEDQRSTKPNSAYGIYTLKASVHVRPQQTTGQRNRFEGLARAIELGSDPTRYSWIVDQADFVNNWRGVIVRADAGVRILRNHFQLGEYPNPPHNSEFSSIPYGLSLLRRGGFVVEQNLFEKSPTAPPTHFDLGLWVDDTRSAYNEIRNDSFVNLTFGTIVHGLNGDDPNTRDGGLKVFCNEHSGNSFDLTIHNSLQHPYGTDVSFNQGSFNQSANNIFSYPLYTNFADWHINYDASILRTVNYWVPPNPRIEEVPTDVFNVTRQTSISGGNPNFCADRYESLSSLNSQDQGERLSLAELKQRYHTALQTCKEEEVKVPCDTAAVSMKGQEVAYWAGEVVFYYQNDTTGHHWDSLEVWLQKVPGLLPQYDVVELYWSQGRYNEALTYLDYIRANYTLSPQDQSNHQDYSVLLDLLHVVYDENRNEALLTRAEVAMLREIADRDAGFAAVYAANIINFFYHYEYTYAPTLPELVGTERLEEPLKEQSAQLTIYPNPSHTWADVSYELPKEEQVEGRLVVTALNGQVVQEIDLSQTSGTVELITADWLTGVYFVSLITNDEMTHQTTLVVRR